MRRQRRHCEEKEGGVGERKRLRLSGGYRSLGLSVLLGVGKQTGELWWGMIAEPRLSTMNFTGVAPIVL